jgi:hypothetical protein
MNQIRSIRPPSDDDAVRLVDGDVFADLARQIVATPAQEETAPPLASRRAARGGTPGRAARGGASRRAARRWLIGAPVAGLAAAAVIAAFAVVTTDHATPPKRTGVATHPAAGLPNSATELVDYATKAAAAGPAFNPGPRQWIYTDVLQATSSAGTGGYLSGSPNGRLEQKTWTRVDFQEYAYLKNGALVIEGSNVPRSAKTGRAVEPVPFGWPSVSYSYLNSLPTSPASLLAVIRGNLRTEPDPIGADGAGNVGVFNAVETLMRNTVLPPRLLAALYGVLASDPAVHFERSVTDLAGRTGVGFSTVQEGYLKEQIVVNPRTYAYMGYVDVAVRAHTSTGLDGTANFHKGQILGWQALLASGIVSRPGQYP